MAARLKIACSRAQPGTKMRAASRPSPPSDLPIRPRTATRLGAAWQKSLWKFLAKFSKRSPSGYEQANQPHLRIRRVPFGDRRASLAAAGQADFTHAQGVRDAAGAGSQRRTRGREGRIDEARLGRLLCRGIQPRAERLGAAQGPG